MTMVTFAIEVENRKVIMLHVNDRRYLAMRYHLDSEEAMISSLKENVDQYLHLR
jgi:hypothetical protein